MKNIRNLAILLASILTFASANAEIKSNTNKKETIKTVVESGKKSEKATASQLKKEEEKMNEILKKIKNNNHVSPNARLAFFRQFNCFDDIKLINEVNSEKIEFKLVRGTEVLANEAAPVAITQKMNDREFKKFNISLSC